MVMAGSPPMERDETASVPPPTPAVDPRAVAFARDGFLGPVRIFTRAECRRITAYLQGSRHPAPLDWEKGRAVHERTLYELAIHPALLSPVTAVLGEDVVLWGVSAVRRGPGVAHAWHSDIESSSPDGRFVTVWVGIEHTSRESALQVISRSHHLGKTVQEIRRQRGVRRELATPEAMLDAVREHEPLASLVQPEVTNGDALLFDGRLWHGSNNGRKRGHRLALLFQYAAADSAVRIPDLSQLEWPFQLRSAPRPPVILVSGTDRRGVNRLVPPPPPSSRGLPMVATAIHRFDLPVEGFTRAWQPFPAFRGPTRTLAEMGCHASVLAGGHSPHPPHAHCEEELLLPLHGEAEVLIATSPDDPAPRVERLRPGSVIYYPAWQHHTIRNPGTLPIGYLMFRWSATASTAPDAPPLGMHIVEFGDVVPPAGAAPFWTRRLLEGPTTCLGKLHAHLTVLQPGAGYAAHADAYDVAIVMLSGKVETLGETVGPLSVIYYAAGELHGMKNVGAEPARYVVFEFHAPGVDALPPPVPLYRSLAGKVLRLGKRLARPIWRRLQGHLPRR